MRIRTKAMVIAAGALLAVGAGPALADHAEEHGDTPSCYGNPPPEGSGVTVVSGFTIFANDADGDGDIEVGYRTRDIYGMGSVGTNGASAGVFQPYWDSSGPLGGPHYVDAGFNSGGPCNNTR